MKRSPMNRGTGFRKPELPPRVRPALVPRSEPARATLRIDTTARMSVPIPKTAYVRDERLRDMCRAMPCQHCGAAGPDAGVTWAHSNQGQHGHARGIKASDQFVAAMCWACHAELDQGSAWTRAQRVAVWTAAHRRTVALALQLGTWPAGIEVPQC